MHTGEWWWNTQMTLPVGSSLVPVLITSDQTCLTNFSGDKKLWPIFMSVGNIPSAIRNKPSSQAWILIGLLPIGPKRTKLHLTMTDSAKEGGSEIVCGDENVRRCIPIVSTWLADHMENVNIHCIKVNRCPICTASRDQLGLLPKRPYAQRDHTRYESLWAANNNDGSVPPPPFLSRKEIDCR
ncbi:hypothetical protein BGX38DRAFT_1104444 [Terfezia claveryi]|nr:hypothetical protein BGX38DRAFT_1104444 [Terfezia claveryi]